jgi:putative nucleotidyltransferase with HDIG domain
MSGVVANLSRIRSHNEYTFNHSLNVAILCGLIGKWLGYSGQVLKDLILAGLLHDIGKALTPLEILNKPGKLTMDEMEVIKLHPVQGYNLVSNREDISDEVKIGILQHHERLDGSGYPLGLSKDAISNFSCIISIADMYDAMTAERVYRKRMSPFSAAETIIKEMYNKLDPNISLIFLTKVQSCLIGSRVLLSNGKIGKVLLFNNDPCTRPIVKLDDDTLINLEKNRSIEIVDLIEERKSR